jgi:YhcH/YjgK/YiaL family protein
MVADTVRNSAAYEGLSAGLRKAFDFMRAHDLRMLGDGKHEIDGDRVYVLMQSYTTKPEIEARLEAHRRYLDIQVVLEGREIIYWAPIEGLEADGAYSEERDVIFYKGSVPGAVTVPAGCFAIFYPQDGHKPCCHWGAAAPVRKAVFKVRV